MKKDTIINVIILVVFIGIAIFVGANHEPWADEAQSWLIARDATVSEILFTIERYEGTPPLWHLLLKLLINLGYQYEYFYLISVFFSSLGVRTFSIQIKITNTDKSFITFYIFLFIRIYSKSKKLLFNNASISIDSKYI